MSVVVTYNEPAVPLTGEESVEFTFWFKLDGTRDVAEVCDFILHVLENEEIEGIKYEPTFRSPFAKLYSP